VLKTKETNVERSKETSMLLVAYPCTLAVSTTVHDLVIPSPPSYTRTLIVLRKRKNDWWWFRNLVATNYSSKGIT